MTPTILLIAAFNTAPVQTTWPIYVAASLSGMVRSFIVPVYNALFARVLPREDYARGAGLGTVTFQASLVLSPMLGGILIALGGKGLAYAAGVVAAIIALLALALLRVEEPTVDKPRAPVLDSIAEGLRFVFSNQILLGCDGTGHVLRAVGGCRVDAAGVHPGYFSLWSEWSGILRGTPALGSVLTGLWLARYPLQRHAGRT